MDEQKENIATTETVETGSADNQVKVNQESAPADKSFTQEDVDRIITNRLKQVERKFENINVEEYHQLKSAAEQAKEAEMMDLVKDKVWPFKHITKEIASKAFPNANIG